MANMQIGKLTVIGNKARMEQLSESVRKTIASNAAKVRWQKRDDTLCAQCGIKFSFHKPPMAKHPFKMPESQTK